MEQSKQIGKLLNDLQSKDSFVKNTAAENLGKLKTSDEQVIRILKIVSESDENKYVRQTATSALKKMGILVNTPITVSRPDTPAALSLGIRFSLAILGVATTGIVSSFIFMLWTPGFWGLPDWRTLLLAWIYPLELAAEGATVFLLFGFVYLVPCIIAFKVPAKMHTVDAVGRVLLSGCVAGLVYEMGLFLAVVAGGGM
jgi:hypothetical protein